jgi:uncharacterized membrane protein YfcA
MFPLQAWYFRHNINWPLFWHLTISQMFGLFLGSYLLFYVTSPWFARVLGIGFAMIALDKLVAEAQIMARQASAGTAGHAEQEKLRELELQQEYSDDAAYQAKNLATVTAAARTMVTVTEDPHTFKPVLKQLAAAEGVPLPPRLPVVSAEALTPAGVSDSGVPTASQSLTELEATMAPELVVQPSAITRRRMVSADTVEPAVKAASGYVVNTWQRVAAVWLCGVSSGLTNGLFGTGGPSLMLFITYYGIGKDETRGTLGLMFFISALFRSWAILYVQTAVDVFTPHMATMLALLSVSSVLLLHVGNTLAEGVNQDAFRRLLLVLLVSGSTVLMSYQCDAQTKLLFVGCTLVVMATVYMAVYARLVEQDRNRRSLAHFEEYAPLPGRSPALSLSARSPFAVDAARTEAMEAGAPGESISAPALGALHT